ncbi:HNH endonuclease [Streptomyces albus subsp. chlorinus]|uniref:HNH endonuclease family protein n=1 Tax=Streptomyces albus TaxID=1888 RepID=UPI00156EC700|nr:HNH endonuclease family protein [Streptomyces albus]NSC25404.1 HNH endonuclease [Streptomyces albus subsp. chlorinus]
MRCLGSGVRGTVLLTVLAVAGLSSAGCSSSGDEDASSPASEKPAASAPAAEGKAAGEKGLPGVPSAAKARRALSELKVAPHGPMTGYSRAKFPHWSAQGDDCDTREKVLARSGTDVERDAECRAVSGNWTSLYDGKKITDASELDIDHMVPLANAWRSGAARWTQHRREDFANDLGHPQLLAVTASANRAKGDQGPEEWQPPAKDSWCTYARAWTSVKAAYRLTVTSAEKSALGTMLESCDR